MLSPDVERPRVVGPNRPAVFQVGVAILVIGAATMILRAAPLFDPGIAELWGRLRLVRDQATAARDTPDLWPAFAAQAETDLKQIADEARRAHQRQLGLWSWIGASDQREVLALKEAQRIAESDLPSLIASGPKGNALRESSVDEALARLDDHLAGASPYLPPFVPVENQEGMDATTGVWFRRPRLIVCIIIGELIVIVVGGAWWWKRSKQRLPAHRPMS